MLKDTFCCHPWATLPGKGLREAHLLCKKPPRTILMGPSADNSIYEEFKSKVTEQPFYGSDCEAYEDDDDDGYGDEDG